MISKLYNKKFEKIKKLGEGSYGVVYKVVATGNYNITVEDMEKAEEDKVYYALKKFNKKIISEGIDFTALREMTILKELNHDNIVKV
jgi:serine/threonine protein kinase